jgi:hypothetical protein
MIIIIMRGENLVAHLDGLGGTPVCREHRLRITELEYTYSSEHHHILLNPLNACFYLKNPSPLSRSTFPWQRM